MKSANTMPNYEFLSWGANSHCQLGHGDQSEQCLIPKAVNLYETDLRPEDIVKVTGGAGHTLILTREGRVYVCGWNHRGQAGIPGREVVERIQQIKQFDHVSVTDIECGWDSSAAIDADGSLYVWGSNTYGQLGHSPKEFPYFQEPRRIIFQHKLRQVSMGLRHTAVVTEIGEVFVTGAGNHSQLGLISDVTDARNAETFTRVPDCEGIVMIACGQRHTIALSRGGEIYAWGDNKHGQLGPETFEKRVKTPVKLRGIEANGNSKIYAGWTHNLLWNDGQIMAWGRNTYGQIGRTESGFEFMEENPKIVEIAVGSEHNVARTENGRIISWGWNEHGNCGDGTEKDRHCPVDVKFDKCDGYVGRLIGTGSGHSFAVIMTED